MIPPAQQAILNTHAQTGMNHAIVANALRGERRVGPRQQMVLINARRMHEVAVREHADICIRLRAHFLGS